MMNNKEIDYTARTAPGDYEGRSHRACVWYNRARAAFDLATLDTLTTAAETNCFVSEQQFCVPF